MNPSEINSIVTGVSAIAAALITAQTQVEEKDATISALEQTILDMDAVHTDLLNTIADIQAPTAVAGTVTPVRLPEFPEVLPVVRFLSKSASMGGLANIRAYLQDIGANVKRLRLEGSTYSMPEDGILINWGGGFDIPENVSNFNGKWLNNLDAVKVAANKLKTFEALKADPYLKDFIPRFTESMSEAANDFNASNSIYARQNLYGHSGEGIVVVAPNAELEVVAPLYVEGVTIKHEYRVHTANGFTKIQKKAQLGDTAANSEIRNNVNGWTFINEFTLGQRGRTELNDLSNKVLNCLNLDFGAVDLIRTMDNKWIVLEVNTAPGVTAESNIEWYSKALLASN